MARGTENFELLTVGDAADQLGVSVDTDRRWHKKGLIKASIGSGGARLFSRDELTRVASRNEGESAEWHGDDE